MLLPDVISKVRIEVQDSGEVIYTNDEITRGLEKSVSLMSRFIPKRSTVTLTLTAPMILDNFSVSFSTVLTDFIKIEKVEAPTGNTPPTYPTFDVIGTTIFFRAAHGLVVGNIIRLIYLEKWVSPLQNTEGNFPSHLLDPLIIGTSGQVLIFKAEKYMQESVSIVEDVVAAITALDSITLVDPTLTPPTVPILDVLTAPTDYVVVKPAVPTLPTTPSTPAAPTLVDIASPSVYSVIKPTKPTLPAAPTAPTTPTLTFTNFDAALTLAASKFASALTTLTEAAMATALAGSATALGKVAADMAAGKTFLTTGSALINTATRGEQVGKNYGEYSNYQVGIGQGYANEGLTWNDLVAKRVAVASELGNVGAKHIAQALAELDKLKATLTKYENDVSVYYYAVVQYGSQVGAMENAFSVEAQVESLGVNNFSTQVELYKAVIQEELMKVSKYSEQIRAFMGEVSDYGTDCSFKISVYQGQLQAENIAVNNYSAAVSRYRAQVDNQALKISKYSEEVKGFIAKIQDYGIDAEAFNTKVTSGVNKATLLSGQVTNYLNIAGRYLASGQAKINEFLAAMGIKPEFPTNKASSEQFA